MPNWVDPDDAPMLLKEFFKTAQHSVGGRVVRPASGVLTEDGVKQAPPYTIPRGRPVEGEAPKQQVTLRLDADLLNRFRTSGRGWQTRLNATLRKAVGM